MISFLVVAICVVVVLAVAGASMLLQSVERRLAPHRDFVLPSTLERPLVGWLFGLARVARRPALWPGGLLHGLELLVGSDSIAALSEDEVRAWAENERLDLRSTSKVLENDRRRTRRRKR